MRKIKSILYLLLLILGVVILLMVDSVARFGGLLLILLPLTVFIQQGWHNVRTLSGHNGRRPVTSLEIKLHGKGRSFFKIINFFKFTLLDLIAVIAIMLGFTAFLIYEYGFDLYAVDFVVPSLFSIVWIVIFGILRVLKE